jgi:hypothetical protein
MAVPGAAQSIASLITEWPDEILALPDNLDRLLVRGLRVYVASGETLAVAGTVGSHEEVEVDLPLIPGLTLGLGSPAARGVYFDFRFALIGDTFYASVASFAASLFIQSGLLKPVDPVPDESGAVVFQPRVDPVTLEPERVEIPFAGVELSLDSTGNLDFDFGGGAPALSVSTFMIGDTGVVVEVRRFSLILSGSAAAGLPETIDPTWRGVFLEEAYIHLPRGVSDILPQAVRFRDAFIGSGGFCGMVSLDLSASVTGYDEGNAKTAFGFGFTFASIGLGFQQNAITGASIKGFLKVPFFDKALAVVVGLTNDGGLTATVVADDGLLTLEVENILSVEVSSVELVEQEGAYFLKLSGTLTPVVGGLDWPSFVLKELTIGSDGSVKVEGGWIDLPEQEALDLYGFRMEIDRIGFGTTDDGRRWIGLSGGVQLVDFLPTGASVEGLRITWDPTGRRAPEVTLQGVGLTLTLPGVLALDGDVAFINEEVERYFKGNAKLALLPLGIALDASIKVGRDAAGDYKYVYTFMDLTLPIGLPLWATGAALYGIAGLYGMNVKPSAQNGDWYGWYAGPPAPLNVTHTDKWIGEADGKAFGAGLTLGTLFDLGRVVSAKALFALVLPGPVILLHGRANFLAVPPDNDDPASEGVFNLLAVLDAVAGSLQLNIDAGWNKAQVIDIAASAEAYFDFANPRAWHFYLGQDRPEDRRVRAYILGLLHGDAYLMISSQGIATGAGISWGYDWKFGPVKVVLRSWIGAEAAISWQPPQLEGRLTLGGEFEVSVAGFGAGLSAEALLSGKAPTLYWVRGEVRLSVKLPVPLKDLEEDIVLEWREEATPASEDPFESIGLEHPKVSETWTDLARSAQTLDPGHPDYDPGPIVPLDARPSVAFDRSMKDMTEGRRFTSVDAYPGSTRVGDHLFDYELLDVALDQWSKAGGTVWMPVEDLYGQWMAVEGSNGEPAFTRLQLWAKSPFAFTRQTSRTYRDSFLASHAAWPCVYPPEVVTHCVDWEGADLETRLGPAFEQGGLHFMLAFSSSVEVVAAGDLDCGTRKALRIDDGLDALWIVFPEPVHTVELCIAGTYGVARAYASGALVGQEVTPGPGSLAFQASGIDSIALWSSDNAILAKICYQTEAMFTEYAATFEHNRSVFDGLKRWESADEILEPETWYRLTVRLQTRRTHEGSSDLEPFTHYAYFQTAGPSGLTPNWALGSTVVPAGGPGDNVELPYPQGGKLIDLQPYVAWTIPADGAQPVYRAYDLGAEFNENYVEQMYGADLAIRLLDGNDRPILDADGSEVLFPNQWGEQPVAELGETEFPYTTRVEDCFAYSGAYQADQKILFANGVLLEEDFSGDLEQWTDPHPETGGGWAIQEGRLRYDNVVVPALGALLVAGDAAWSDYALEVTLGDQGDDVGLAWRYVLADAESYYRLRLNATGRFLERVVRGEIVVLWQDGIGHVAGASQTLAVQCHGTRLRGQLGAELLFDVQDDQALLSGQVGIFTGSTAAFEHFLARTWPGSALAPRTQYQVELLASFVLFTGGLTNGWVDGAYAWVQLARDQARLVVIGRAEWDNYRLEVNVAATGRQVGIVARFQQPTGGTFTCYGFLINLTEKSIHLARLAGTISGAEYEIDDAGSTSLWTCRSGDCEVDLELDTHDLALTCNGPLLVVEVDGFEVARVTDPGGPSTGKAGLYHLGTTAPGFSELVIRSAPRGPVHGWHFVTSRHAGFVEHLDTFTGQVRREAVSGIDARKLADAIAAAESGMTAAGEDLAASRVSLAGASPADVTARRDATQAAARARGLEAAVHFDALDELIFGGAYRPLPSVVEVAEVVQGRRRLALLLESPEPLDWNRIRWELRVLHRASGAYRALGDVLAVWSDDGARAFLMATGATGLGIGEYELQLISDLDIGLEAPLLRRGGSTLPEVGRLRFALP